MAKVALTVSTLSLLIAGAALFFNFLAPFAPLVTVGGPVFQLGAAAPENTLAGRSNGPEFDPQQNRILAVVFVPIVFTHEGGRSGVVSDIMLRLSRTGHDDRWLFEPRMFVDERALLTSFEPNSHLKWLEAVFSPVPLAKGEETRRLVMFQGQENGVFPGGRLRPGRYQLEVLVRVGNSDGYQQVEEFAVDFSSDVLKKLDANIRYAPTPESLLPARNLLK